MTNYDRHRERAGEEYDGEWTRTGSSKSFARIGGETVYFDEEMIDSEDGLICPNCNENHRIRDSRNRPGTTSTDFFAA
jgi:uncharacterized protein YbaR (Trm112 family)